MLSNLFMCPMMDIMLTKLTQNGQDDIFKKGSAVRVQGSGLKDRSSDISRCFRNCNALRRSVDISYTLPWYFRPLPLISELLHILFQYFDFVF
jgi:hypothetical protein